MQSRARDGDIMSLAQTLGPGGAAIPWQCQHEHAAREQEATWQLQPYHASLRPLPRETACKRRCGEMSDFGVSAASEPLTGHCFEDGDAVLRNLILSSSDIRSSNGFGSRVEGPANDGSLCFKAETRFGHCDKFVNISSCRSVYGQHPTGVSKLAARREAPASDSALSAEHSGENPGKGCERGTSGCGTRTPCPPVKPRARADAGQPHALTLPRASGPQHQTSLLDIVLRGF